MYPTMPSRLGWAKRSWDALLHAANSLDVTSIALLQATELEPTFEVVFSFADFFDFSDFCCACQCDFV
jgi:hypothetical protein